jgi:hypothetical protein
MSKDMRDRDVAYFKIATNPFAQDGLPDRDKNRLRALVTVKVPKDTVARRACADLKQGDRVILEGQGSMTMGNPTVRTEDGKYVSIESVEVDGKIIELKIPHFTLRLRGFSKIDQPARESNTVAVASTTTSAEPSETVPEESMAAAA